MRLAWCALLLVGCGAEPEEPGDEVSRLDLRAMFPERDPRVVGVTVDPIAGRRFLLDPGVGIDEISAAGALVASHPFSEIQFPGQAPGVVPLLTDIAAVDPERFLLTGYDEGYLLDLSWGTAEIHFCFVPGDAEPVQPTEEQGPVHTHAHVSQALTVYDATIWAQPLSVAVATGAAERSQVASFDLGTGAEGIWLDLPSATYEAGGMAAESATSLLLGSGADLLRLDLETGEVTAAGSLADAGVTQVEGLAIDPMAGTLLAIDSMTEQLVEVDLASR